MNKTGRLSQRVALIKLPQGYGQFLFDLKRRIRAVQVKASVSFNRELMMLYWDIGGRIVERQKREGWGKNVIQRLAGDLQKAFPGICGLSDRNVWRMRAFYLAYAAHSEKFAQPIREISRLKLPQAVAVIPRGHNILLFE